MAPSFHFLGYGDATGLGEDGESSLAPTSVRYGAELLLMSAGPGSRLFVGLTPSIVHNRLQGPGKDHLTLVDGTSNALGMSARAGVQLGALEISAVYHLNRFRTFSFFTLLVPDLKVSFMAHKRCVVHVARDAAVKMNEFLGDDLPATWTTIAGAILADVGKLLEYDDQGGKTVKSEMGKYLRHPFTGVGLAMEAGVPDRGSATSSRPTPARATWSRAPRGLRRPPCGLHDVLAVQEQVDPRRREKDLAAAAKSVLSRTLRYASRSRESVAACGRRLRGTRLGQEEDHG